MCPLTSAQPGDRRETSTGRMEEQGWMIGGERKGAFGRPQHTPMTSPTTLMTSPTTLMTSGRDRSVGRRETAEISERRFKFLQKRTGPATALLNCERFSQLIVNYCLNVLTKINILPFRCRSFTADFGFSKSSFRPF